MENGNTRPILLRYPLRLMDALLVCEEANKLQCNAWKKMEMSMKRTVDPKGFLIAAAVSLGLSVGAFVILHFAVGSATLLPLRFIELIFLPIYIASGALYVAITVKRRPDLSISLLSLGGALTSILPACVFAVVVSPSGMRVVEGREVRDPSVLVMVMVMVFAVVGVFFGCLGAVVYAMWDEAKSLRRNRRSDSPRPLPKSRKRRI